MNKKYFISLVVSGALMAASSALAYTNCDSQAKPALDCPSGYTIMCIPVGGDHWGCGKESNGMIIEASGSASSSAGIMGVEGTVQTQLEVKARNESGEEVEVEMETLQQSDEDANVVNPK